MDSFHCKAQHHDPQTGRDCRFCKRSDPEFRNRNPMDRLVCSEQDTATVHITENGYVRHWLLEIEVRLGMPKFPVAVRANAHVA